jgi:RNA polymerase sigma-70 factor (ECF subfamily)
VNKEEDEFLKMINENQKVIHNVCRIYTDMKEDHLDLFQEILLQLWNSYSRYKGESKVSTWIYRVALYTSITHIKKVMKDRNTKIELTSEDSYTIEQQNSDVDLLYLALNDLNKSDKGLALLYLEEKSYKEISEILGISESNVGVRINRIKKKLKMILTNLESWN